VIEDEPGWALTEEAKRLAKSPGVVRSSFVHGIYEAEDGTLREFSETTVDRPLTRERP